MIEQLYKVSTYCLDDHVVKKEKLEAVPICVQLMIKYDQWCVWVGGVYEWVREKKTEKKRKTEKRKRTETEKKHEKETENE